MKQTSEPLLYSVRYLKSTKGPRSVRVFGRLFNADETEKDMPSFPLKRLMLRENEAKNLKSMGFEVKKLRQQKPEEKKEI